MMYTALYRYFLVNRNLSVPGIGTFLLFRQPAEIDFREKQIKSPAYSVTFSNQSQNPGNDFFQWLSVALDTNSREAVIRFNDFVFDLKKQIQQGANIDWKGMGTLSRGLAGDVKFIPVKPLQQGSPVHAEKLIRENAEHTVRVGEDHKSSTEMTKLLTQSTSSRSFWWVAALIVGVLALSFTVWHIVSNDGMDKTSNKQPITPIETPVR